MGSVAARAAFPAAKRGGQRVCVGNDASRHHVGAVADPRRVMTDGRGGDTEFLQVIEAADPGAVSAIEGAQIPGWGGYDYSRLASSVDAIEMYAYGENIPIARSFNPRLILLTTSFGNGPSEAHRVWRELLRGTRGLILWDDKSEFVGNDGSLGDRRREAAPYFGEMRNRLGALLINSRRHTDPIGILYSPASRRVQWLLDRRASVEEWSRRGASTEYQDDAIKASTRPINNLTCSANGVVSVPSCLKKE